MDTTSISRIERIGWNEETWRLATAVYASLLDLLEQLGPEEWEAPTVCEPWTVADMVGHVIGAAKGHASLFVGFRQQVVAGRRKGAHGGSALDAWTHQHVVDHADLTPAERLAQLRAIAPRAVRGRSRVPRPLRRVKVAVPPLGSVAEGSPEQVTFGELNAVVFTRDTWLHRMDIARATGRDPGLRPDVDGPIVADVVAEWAARHGEPFELALTGPAGGQYRQGDGGPRLELDAVEFCWILSGRGEPDAGDGAELLRTRVLF